MAAYSPTCQQVPCSPNLVEPVKYSSPIPSVPDVGSPLLNAGREVSHSYSPLLRHLLAGEFAGKRPCPSPPVCSSCKKMKLAPNSDKEQVVPTDCLISTEKIENVVPSQEYVKQFELFIGSDIFATREE